MNELNAAIRRPQPVTIASLKTDSPFFVRGLLEELGVKRWVFRLLVVGLGLIALESPTLVDTLRKTVEVAFATNELSKEDRRSLLQASSAEELDYIRSFFPELQAPQHIDDLKEFRSFLAESKDELKVAKSDIAALESATSYCIDLLRTSLPLEGESALTSAMLYDGQLEKCNNETPLRTKKFLNSFELLTPPSKRRLSLSGHLAQWKNSK